MSKIRVIMAGAGALYPMYIGSLLALEESGHEVSSICGTSGGAIAAATWSLSNVKKDYNNLENFVLETLPINNNIISYSFYNFIKKWGFIDGTNLENLFGKVFKEYLKDSKIPIYIYSAKVTRDENKVFSNILTPEIETKKALRASCSIPLIFDPVKINDELYVDGGWSYHLPLNCFEHEENKHKIIGLRISENKKFNMKNNLVSYIQKIMYNRIVEHHKQTQSSSNVEIFDLNSDFSRLKLASTTNEEAKQIFKEGYEQTKCLIKKQPL